jgi:hypothetical protein
MYLGSLRSYQWMSRDVFWFIHGEDAGVLLAAATGSAVVLTGKGLQGLLVCVMEAV